MVSSSSAETITASSSSLSSSLSSSNIHILFDHSQQSSKQLPPYPQSYQVGYSSQSSLQRASPIDSSSSLSLQTSSQYQSSLQMTSPIDNVSQSSLQTSIIENTSQLSLQTRTIIDSPTLSSLYIASTIDDTSPSSLQPSSTVYDTSQSSLDPSQTIDNVSQLSLQTNSTLDKRSHSSLQPSQTIDNVSQLSLQTHLIMDNPSQSSLQTRSTIDNTSQLSSRTSLAIDDSSQLLLHTKSTIDNTSQSSLQPSQTIDDTSQPSHQTRTQHSSTSTYIPHRDIERVSQLSPVKRTSDHSMSVSDARMSVSDARTDSDQTSLEQRPSTSLHTSSTNIGIADSYRSAYSQYGSQQESQSVVGDVLNDGPIYTSRSSSARQTHSASIDQASASSANPQQESQSVVGGVLNDDPIVASRSSSARQTQSEAIESAQTQSESIESASASSATPLDVIRASNFSTSEVADWFEAAFKIQRGKSDTPGDVTTSIEGADSESVSQESSINSDVVSSSENPTPQFTVTDDKTSTILQSVFSTDDQSGTILQSVSSREGQSGTLLQSAYSTDDKSGKNFLSAYSTDDHSTILQSVSNTDDKSSTILQSAYSTDDHSTILQSAYRTEDHSSTIIQSTSGETPEVPRRVMPTRPVTLTITASDVIVVHSLVNAYVPRSEDDRKTSEQDGSRDVSHDQDGSLDGSQSLDGSTSDGHPMLSTSDTSANRLESSITSSPGQLHEGSYPEARSVISDHQRGHPVDTGSKPSESSLTFTETSSSRLNEVTNSLSADVTTSITESPLQSLDMLMQQLYNSIGTTASDLSPSSDISLDGTVIAKSLVLPTHVLPPRSSQINIPSDAMTPRQVQSTSGYLSSRSAQETRGTFSHSSTESRPFASSSKSTIPVFPSSTWSDPGLSADPFLLPPSIAVNVNRKHSQNNESSISEVITTSTVVENKDVEGKTTHYFTERRDGPTASQETKGLEGSSSTSGYSSKESATRPSLGISLDVHSQTLSKFDVSSSLDRTVTTSYDDSMKLWSPVSVSSIDVINNPDNSDGITTSSSMQVDSDVHNQRTMTSMQNLDNSKQTFFEQSYKTDTLQNPSNSWQTGLESSQHSDLVQPVRAWLETVVPSLNKPPGTPAEISTENPSLSASFLASGRGTDQDSHRTVISSVTSDERLQSPGTDPPLMPSGSGSTSTNTAWPWAEYVGISGDASYVRATDGGSTTGYGSGGSHDVSTGRTRVAGGSQSLLRTTETRSGDGRGMATETRTVNTDTQEIAMPSVVDNDISRQTVSLSRDIPSEIHSYKLYVEDYLSTSFHQYESTYTKSQSTLRHSNIDTFSVRKSDYLKIDWSDVPVSNYNWNNDVSSIRPSRHYSSSDVSSIRPSRHYSSSDVASIRPSRHYSSSDVSSIRPSRHYSSSDVSSIRPSRHYSSSDAASIRPSRHYSSSDVSSIRPSRHYSNSDASSIRPSRHYSSSDASSIRPSRHYSSSDVSPMRPSHDYSSSDASSIRPSRHYSSSDAASIRRHYSSSDRSSSNIDTSGVLQSDRQLHTDTSTVEPPEHRQPNNTGMLYSRLHTPFDSLEDQKTKTIGHSQSSNLASLEITPIKSTTRYFKEESIKHVLPSGSLPLTTSSWVTSSLRSTDGQSAELTRPVVTAEFSLNTSPHSEPSVKFSVIASTSAHAPMIRTSTAMADTSSVLPPVLPPAGGPGGAQTSPGDVTKDSDLKDYTLTWIFDPKGNDVTSKEFMVKILEGLKLTYEIGSTNKIAFSKKKINIRVKRDVSQSNGIQIKIQSTKILKSGNVQLDFTVLEDGKAVPSKKAVMAFNTVSLKELDFNTGVQTVSNGKISLLQVTTSQGTSTPVTDTAYTPPRDVQHPESKDVVRSIKPTRSQGTPAATSTTSVTAVGDRSQPTSTSTAVEPSQQTTMHRETTVLRFATQSIDTLRSRLASSEASSSLYRETPTIGLETTPLVSATTESEYRRSVLEDSGLLPTIHSRTNLVEGTMRPSQSFSNFPSRSVPPSSEYVDFSVSNSANSENTDVSVPQSLTSDYAAFSVSLPVDSYSGIPNTVAVPPEPTLSASVLPSASFQSSLYFSGQPSSTPASRLSSTSSTSMPIQSGFSSQNVTATSSSSVTLTEVANATGSDASVTSTTSMDITPTLHTIQPISSLSSMRINSMSVNPLTSTSLSQLTTTQSLHTKLPSSESMPSADITTSPSSSRFQGLLYSSTSELSQISSDIYLGNISDSSISLSQSVSIDSRTETFSTARIESSSYQSADDVFTLLSSRVEKSTSSDSNLTTSGVEMTHTIPTEPSVNVSTTGSSASRTASSNGLPITVHSTMLQESQMMSATSSSVSSSSLSVTVSDSRTTEDLTPSLPAMMSRLQSSMSSLDVGSSMGTETVQLATAQVSNSMYTTHPSAPVAESSDFTNNSLELATSSSEANYSDVSTNSLEISTSSQFKSEQSGIATNSLEFTTGAMEFETSSSDIRHETLASFSTEHLTAIDSTNVTTIRETKASSATLDSSVPTHLSVPVYVSITESYGASSTLSSIPIVATQSPVSDVTRDVTFTPTQSEETVQFTRPTVTGMVTTMAMESYESVPNSSAQVSTSGISGIPSIDVQKSTLKSSSHDIAVSKSVGASSDIVSTASPVGATTDSLRTTADYMLTSAPSSVLPTSVTVFSATLQASISSLQTSAQGSPSPDAGPSISTASNVSTSLTANSLDAFVQSSPASASPLSTTLTSGSPFTTLTSGSPSTTLTSVSPSTTLTSGSPSTTLTSGLPSTTLTSGSSSSTTLASGSPSTTSLLTRSSTSLWQTTVISEMLASTSSGSPPSVPTETIARASLLPTTTASLRRTDLPSLSPSIRYTESIGRASVSSTKMSTPELSLSPSFVPTIQSASLRQPTISLRTSELRSQLSTPATRGTSGPVTTVAPGKFTPTSLSSTSLFTRRIGSASLSPGVSLRTSGISSLSPTSASTGNTASVSLRKSTVSMTTFFSSPSPTSTVVSASMWTTTVRPTTVPPPRGTPPDSSRLVVTMNVSPDVDISSPEFSRQIEIDLTRLYTVALNLRQKRDLERLIRRRRQSEISAQVLSSERDPDLKVKVSTTFAVHDGQEYISADGALLVYNKMTKNQMSDVMTYPVTEPITAAQSAAPPSSDTPTGSSVVVLVVAVVIPALFLLLLVLLVTAWMRRRRRHANAVSDLPPRYPRGERLEDHNLTVDVEKGEIVDKTPTATPSLTPRSESSTVRKIPLKGGVCAMSSDDDDDSLRKRKSEKYDELMKTDSFRTRSLDKETHRRQILREKELLEKLGVHDVRTVIDLDDIATLELPKRTRSKKSTRNSYNTVGSECPLLSASGSLTTVSSIDSGDHTDASDEFMMIIASTSSPSLEPRQNSRSKNGNIETSNTEIPLVSSVGVQASCPDQVTSAAVTRTVDTQTSKQSSVASDDSDSSSPDGKREVIRGHQDGDRQSQRVALKRRVYKRRGETEDIFIDDDDLNGPASGVNTRLSGRKAGRRQAEIESDQGAHSDQASLEEDSPSGTYRALRPQIAAQTEVTPSWNRTPSSHALRFDDSDQSDVSGEYMQIFPAQSSVKQKARRPPRPKPRAASRERNKTASALGQDGRSSDERSDMCEEQEAVIRTEEVTKQAHQLLGQAHSLGFVIGECESDSDLMSRVRNELKKDEKRLKVSTDSSSTVSGGSGDRDPSPETSVSFCSESSAPLGGVPLEASPDSTAALLERVRGQLQRL